MTSGASGAGDVTRIFLQSDSARKGAWIEGRSVKVIGPEAKMTDENIKAILGAYKTYRKNLDVQAKAEKQSTRPLTPPRITEVEKSLEYAKTQVTQSLEKVRSVMGQTGLSIEELSTREEQVEKDRRSLDSD